MAVSFFGRHKRDANTAFKRMGARPLGNVLTIAVLAFALTLPTCLYLLAKNVLLVSDALPRSSQLTVYLTHVPSDSQRDVMLTEWRSWSKVDSVTYISPDEGIEEFYQFQGFAEAIPLLDNNPLPGVMVVEPVSEALDDVVMLAQRLSAEEGVDDVRMDSDWIERFVGIKAVLIKLALVFSVLMLLVVFLVIGNTLRLQVLDEKSRIQVMKLVGATDADILRPYLYTGIGYAGFAAAIAWSMAAGITLLVDQSVIELADLYGATFRLSGMGIEETGLLFGAAILLGLMAGQLSAQRHLREIEPV
ncbi:permease-like cell division protein FtsX [Thaumasiovibrio subtropicus]|uniref:permease-like cell division protein FtsX n=1 Tax=Thaumasiovibrio subtropicus TaxID=1891207 RepID=UPI000B3590E9|nr:permease-like cell division protein FtsX [Thaumasiovibrio subtropicus]